MKFAMRPVAHLLLLASALVGTAACGGDELGTNTEAHTEIPAEGSCEADAMLKVANEASLEELDDAARLDKRAAENIVAARPIGTLQELDEVAYVGSSAMHRILDYAEERGELAACSANCDEVAVLRVANELTQEELDDVVGLDSRAAANIVEARPLASFEALDEVGYVGQSALGKLLAYAQDAGFVAACDSSSPSVEIGILSDLDKTVIPPAEPDLSKAPYPGVTKLYQLLENRNGGADGDMYFVTARQPEMVVDIPDYLEQHDVPGGPIETGISGLPWVAEPEKVADISGVLDGTGEQRFVLFGDSSHRDPEAYKTIRNNYGDRIIAGFIHKVNNTVSPHRVEGLYLHEGYDEVAAILYGLGVLERAEAKSVMEAAVAEGLSLTEAEMEDLLDQHAP